LFQLALSTFLTRDIFTAYFHSCTKKNGFVTATKLGTIIFVVAATKNFAATTKRFVGRNKHFVVVTNYVAIPILTNDFVGMTKPFVPSVYCACNCYALTFFVYRLTES